MLFGQGWDRGRDGGRGGLREEAAVILYSQPNFRGQALKFYPGDEVENLADMRFADGSRVNDRVMSVEITGSASVVLHEDSRFRGAALRTTSDLRDLGVRYLPDSPNHWGNRISSLRVEDDGRGRPVRLTAEQAERAVRAAYRSVLDRDADAEGRRFYSRLMLDQGWTGEMVEDALRKSDEYRGQRVDRFVHEAYQDVLRRDADPTGLRHYRGLILDHGWTVERIKNDLRGSREYRERIAVGPRANRPAPDREG